VPTPCPCQTGLPYANCCQPLHQGNTAPSAEALMRSRFSAFTLGLPNYLLASWHPSTKPAQINLDNTLWGRLVIHPQDEPEHVHFSAFFNHDGEWYVQSELSTFCQENNQWFYLAGTPSVAAWQPQRNAPCPCGASKKYKQCCLTR